MTLIAFIIAVSLAGDADYNDLANNLRLSAKRYGCTWPVVERLADDGDGLQRLMVTCRGVTPDEEMR
jgi:hypothetical protein